MDKFSAERALIGTIIENPGASLAELVVVDHLFEAVAVEDVVLAAFQLDDVVCLLEDVQTDGALSCLFEKNVSEREVFYVSHYLSVHLPPL